MVRGKLGMSLRGGRHGCDFATKALFSGETRGGESKNKNGFKQSKRT